MSHEIVPLSGLDCRLEPQDWAFARERRAEIDRFWRGFVAEKPESYNGRVLIQHGWRLDGAHYSGRYLETDYASFLAWREFGFPGAPMRNGFAMAALQAADGAFLLGIMGAHTANPGRIYFAAGTPDPGDVTADGRIDLAGSVTRELEEETGLRPDEIETGAGWTAVIAPPRVAFMRPCRIGLPAREAQALIEARIAAQEKPELAGIHIVRGPEDLDPARMPDFMLAYLRSVFVQAG